MSSSSGPSLGTWAWLGALVFSFVLCKQVPECDNQIVHLREGSTGQNRTAARGPGLPGSGERL